MKKSFSAIFLLVVLLTGCNKKEKLYIIDWHSSFDDKLIDKFEDEYNVKVIIDKVDSNEDIYNEIKSDNKYDLAISQDYMVEKMIKEELLSEMNFLSVEYKPVYFDELNKLHKMYDAEDKYSIPLSWGNIGIMFNKTVEDKVMNNEWKVLFEDINGIDKVGMNNQSRNMVSSALTYLNLDPNTTLESDLSLAEAVLKKFEYETFIDLEQKVANNEIDVALVYSNEFFKMIDLNNEEAEKFGFIVPNKSNIWINNIVIPKTNDNEDLTYEFINFMLNTDNAYTNAISKGYTPVDRGVYSEISTDETMNKLINYQFYYPINNEGIYIYRDLGDEYYLTLDSIIKNVKD